MSFSTEQLAQNYFAALEEVLRLKPSASKGRYLRKVTISTTMGPGSRSTRARRSPTPRRRGHAGGAADVLVVSWLAAVVACLGYGVSARSCSPSGPGGSTTTRA